LGPVKLRGYFAASALLLPITTPSGVSAAAPSEAALPRKERLDGFDDSFTLEIIRTIFGLATYNADAA
jgi:hypothetical protein